MTAERLAELFFTCYERRAPYFHLARVGTPSIPWEQAPYTVQHLLVSTCREVLQRMAQEDTQEVSHA